MDIKDIKEELLNATSYAKMQRFMKNESGLEYLGSGSARIVFALDDDSVIKVAKNEFGLHQNAMETDGYINDSFDHFLATTKDFDEENYRFTIAERACSTLKSKVALGKAIEEHFGVKGDDFNQFIHHLSGQVLRHDNESYKAIGKIFDKYEDNELLADLQELCGNTDALPGDWDRHSSWGFVGDKLCIKDFGLNKENFQTYVLKNDKPAPSRKGPYMGY